jgi:hypothetical protein
MANKRIKDLTQTATTLANDDYVAIDGSSNGTRKIVKGDLVNDISSQVAGTYLDEANNLSDVASLDTSKLNLEVPDVGTAPNEVPLNGMLGDMAYQSAEGISVARAEVESTTGTATTQALTVTDGTDTKFLVQEDGRVGIGLTPSYALHVSGDIRNDAAVFLNDGKAVQWGGTDARIVGSSGGDYLRFYTAGLERFTINSSGNLVVGTGLGIDFGSTTTGTGTPSGGLLSDYEEGTFTVTTNGDATGVIAGQYGEYTKIGRLVTVRITFQVTTDFTDNLIGGLPFQVDAPSTGGSSVSTGGIVFSSSGNGSPLTCHTNDNTTTVRLLSGTSVVTNHQPNTSNSTYRIQFSYNTD